MRNLRHYEYLGATTLAHGAFLVSGDRRLRSTNPPLFCPVAQ
jgi:hypothetical protein